VHAVSSTLPHPFAVGRFKLLRLFRCCSVLE